MGSSYSFGGSGDDSSYGYYIQQQQMNLQKEQMARQSSQQNASLDLQRKALEKPVAAVGKEVSSAASNMVSSQEEAKSNLNGIRSTYSMFAKNNTLKGNTVTGASKLGE